LAVAGRLDEAIGGSPRKAMLEPSATRRSVYGYIDRTNLPVLLRSFDYPSPDSTSPQRDTTIVPQQALFLMNNPLVVASGAGSLGPAGIGAGAGFARLITRIVGWTYGREPTGKKFAAREFFWARGNAGPLGKYAQACFWLTSLCLSIDGLGCRLK